MRFDVQYRPSYALALVQLEAGETVVAESGSMVSKDTHVKVETRAGKKGDGVLGGLMSGFKRMVAGESFFQNRFTAHDRAGEVTFAPTLTGDIVVHTLESRDELYMQSTAFLCSEESVQLDTKWGGAKTFFGGEGLVMLRATGQGALAFNAFGGVTVIDVDGSYTVDTGHIVAFEGTLSFRVGRFAGGWRQFIFGGEGLVCHFSGKGKLWIQSRNPHAFGQVIGPLLPMREN